MTTGEKIALKRRERNLTQEELGNALGVSRQAISRWEGDAAFPETESLIRMSEMFGCSVDYLLKESVLDEKDTVETTPIEGADEKETKAEEIIDAPIPNETKPKRGPNWWSRHYRTFVWAICFALSACFIISGILALVLSPSILEIIKEALTNAQAELDKAGVTAEAILSIVRNAMNSSGITCLVMGGLGLIPGTLFLVLDVRYQRAHSA